jgi:hypothetical protein
MSEPSNNPITVETEHGADGQIVAARIRFGPHYLVEVRGDGSSVSFTLVRTHHGFSADASEVGGELETIIDEVRRARPAAAVD